jgi:lysophospholipase
VKLILWDILLTLNTGLAVSGIEETTSINPSTYQPTSYAPIYVECPAGVEWIRHPKGLNPKEAEWVDCRKRVVADALDTYLGHLCLEGFDTKEYIHAISRSDYAHVPILGLAISGGGYRSGYTGTGAIRALDSRLPAAKEQRVGGLLQSLMYLTGLSWIDRQGNSTNSTAPGSPVSIIVDLAGKLQAGFNISATDYLGRLAAYEFLPGPHGGANSTWSGVTRLSNFINHQMPFPMLQASELTDDDKEYLGIEVPYYNATSARNKVSITLDAAKD